MNIGEAVRARIIELCRQRDISINKLCSISGRVFDTCSTLKSLQAAEMRYFFVKFS